MGIMGLVTAKALDERCPDCGRVTVYAAARYDPTRTTTLRNQFVREMNKRFTKLRGVIRRAIVDEDCFGLAHGTDGVFTVMAEMVTPGRRAFDFPRSGDKVAAFMDWLKKQEEAGILEVMEHPQLGEGIEEAWTNKYIQSAYQKGIARARQELKKAGYKVPSIEETGGIHAAFNTPFHLDRVGLLYTRTFNDLKGITDAMDAQVSRVLAKGMAEGRNPRELARLLTKTISGSGPKTPGSIRIPLDAFPISIPRPAGRLQQIVADMPKSPEVTEMLRAFKDTPKSKLLVRMDLPLGAETKIPIPIGVVSYEIEDGVMNIRHIGGIRKGVKEDLLAGMTQEASYENLTLRVESSQEGMMDYWERKGFQLEPGTSNVFVASPKDVKLSSRFYGESLRDLGITDTLGRFIPAQRRATILARTEIIRAHHQATIQEYRNWAVEGVIVKAEFATAGDSRVCPKCAALEGRIFALDKKVSVGEPTPKPKTKPKPKPPQQPPKRWRPISDVDSVRTSLSDFGFGNVLSEAPAEITLTKVNEFGEHLSSVFERRPGLARFMSKRADAKSLGGRWMSLELLNSSKVSSERLQGGGRRDVLGLFNKDYKVVTLPGRRKKKSWLRIAGQDTLFVGDGAVDVLRHEYGHGVYHTFMNREERLAWIGLWDSLGGASYFRSKVGRYSGTNVREAFAECFCAWTHPDYGKSRVKTLPKEIEQFFDGLFGEGKVSAGKPIPKPKPKPTTPTVGTPFKPAKNTTELRKRLRTYGITDISGMKDVLDARVTTLDGLNQIGDALGNDIFRRFKKLRERVDKLMWSKKGDIRERLGLDVGLGKPTARSVSRSGPVAFYSPGTLSEERPRITVYPNAWETSAADLHLGNTRFVVGDSFKNTFRHEYGHHLYYRLLTPTQRGKWEKFFNARVDSFDKVSQYARSTAGEGFAETFAAVTSREYDWAGEFGTRRRLPKDIEDMITHFIGKPEE